jgi:hypothetical protein
MEILILQLISNYILFNETLYTFIVFFYAFSFVSLLHPLVSTVIHTDS